MDEFQFKSPAAIVNNTLKIPDIQGESQIEILNLNVSTNAIWGTNGTAIVVEPPLDSDDLGGAFVSFEDPLFG